MSSQAIVIMVLSEVAQFLVVDKALEKITGRRANKEKTKMTNVTFESIRNAMKTNQGVNKAKVVQEKVVEATKKTVGAVGGIMPVSNNKMDHRTEDILKLLAATQLEVADLKRQLGVKTQVDHKEVENLASTYLQFMKNGEKETKTAEPEAPQAVVEAPVAESIKETEVVQEAVTETPVPSQEVVEIPPTQEPTVAKSPTMNPLNIQFDQPSNWHMGPQV
jgi:hypothetical protein